MDKELLKSGLLHFGQKDTDKIVDSFEKYMKLLLLRNEKVNLTRIVQPDEIVTKHFVDSISCALEIEKGARVIDVGSGAGFPGVPLKIVREDINITLLDSLAKRVAFLDEVKEELGLSGVTTIHSRAEDGGRNPEYREKFHVALARAVASLDTLCEYCLPYVLVGGVFIAFKGREVMEEVEAGKKAIKILGGEVVNIKEVFWGGMEHSLVIVKKVSKTPEKYPRKAGKPAKVPII